MLFICFRKAQKHEQQIYWQHAPHDQTNWATVNTLTDADIIHDADSPSTTEADWKQAFTSHSAAELHTESVRRTRGVNKQPHKEQVAIRYGADILAHFRSTGKGWQTRMNNALKEWLKEHTA
jgi:uncharacterized protein (DUF4415 family)